MFAQALPGVCPEYNGFNPNLSFSPPKKERKNTFDETMRSMTICINITRLRVLMTKIMWVNLLEWFSCLEMPENLFLRSHFAYLGRQNTSNNSLIPCIELPTVWSLVPQALSRVISEHRKRSKPGTLSDRAPK